MQQTETYKLNLIETSDTFSPNPLNENAQKVENAITAARADANAGDTALGLRLAALEARKIVYGSFPTTGSTQTINLGFTPAMVFLQNSHNYASCMALTDKPFSGTVLKIVPGGFTLGTSADHNVNNRISYYLAIL